MIRLPGLAFGWGVYGGTPHEVSDVRHSFTSTAMEETVVAVAVDVPSQSRLRQLASVRAVSAVVVPACSAYSHVVRRYWDAGVPCIAVAGTGVVLEAQYVVADLDCGEVLVPESEAEASALLGRHYHRCSPRDVPSGETFQIRVLAELRDAETLARRALRSADGIAVIPIEALTLWGDDSGRPKRSDLAELLAEVGVSPKVRFYDERASQPGEASSSACLCGKLGHRGIRLVEVQTDLVRRFAGELEVLGNKDLTVVLPMVSTADEVRRFEQLLETPAARLGVTVETPAAALRIEDFVGVVGFVEVGVNDLTQYTMAWDRDQPHWERLPPQHLAPAVGDLVGSVVECCERNGIEYTVGVDMRPNPRLLTQIVRLGVNSVSVPAGLVGPWKKAAGANSR